MYVNKCTKCGSEFETKNPKRVICPNCLYPDKKMALSSDSVSTNLDSQQKYFSGENNDQNPQQGQSGVEQQGNNQPQQKFYNSYSQDAPQPRPYNRPPQNRYNQDRGGYNRPQQSGYSQGGYNRPQSGGYNQNRSYNQGGYNRPQQSGYSQGGYNRPQSGGYNQNRSYNQGGYNRPQQGGYNRPQQSGYNQGGYNRPQSGGYNRQSGGNRGFQRPSTNRNKPLLVSREQLEQIELLYKSMLPLPNPDAHEVIGAKIELEPRKVFFGINLIRQKMMLTKLPFPKRKLAISPDQMFAIQNLYEPLLPLPPIGCHKILAAQLKMDEWRVHVGIGLVRAKMGLDRWNQDREDAPEEFKAQKAAKEAEAKKELKKKTTKAKKVTKVKEPKATKVKAEKTTKEKKPKKTPKTKKDDTIIVETEG